MRLFFALLVMVPWLASPAAAQPVPAPAPFNPAETEIVVLGTDHLLGIDRAANPVAVDIIRGGLARFRPDLIVVEWLHPSVDRAGAFNYNALGDRATLGRLWGYDQPAVAERLVAFRDLIERLKAARIATTGARIELGKLYYLSGDELNAAYQWWRAGRTGGDIADLRRLTQNNMAGHELEVWGFQIAFSLGHEYLSPFDYQGNDVGSEVWGQLLDGMRDRVLRRQGLGPRSAGYRAAADAFDAARTRFESGESQEWADSHAGDPEVVAYVRVWEAYQELARRRPAADPAGLAVTSWLQGETYLSAERHINFELLPAIPVDGLGQRRLDGNVHRNVRMAEFADRDVRRLGARRVLVIVGSGHKLFLEAEFRRLGYRIGASGDYVPGRSNSRLPTS